MKLVTEKVNLLDLRQNLEGERSYQSQARPIKKPIETSPRVKAQVFSVIAAVRFRNRHYRVVSSGGRIISGCGFIFLPRDMIDSDSISS